MSDITPQELAALRDAYRHMAEPRSTSPEEIKIRLTDMGLDIYDDATYDLLKLGLTKFDFDNRAFLRNTYSVAKHYCDAQMSPDISKKYFATFRLISELKQLDFYSGEYPADTDEEHREIMKRLLDKLDNGELQKYCDTLNAKRHAAIYETLKEKWWMQNATYKSGIEPDYNTTSAFLLHDRYGDPDSSIKEFKQSVANLDPGTKGQFLELISRDEAELESKLNKMHKGMALAFVRAMLKGNHMCGDCEEALKELKEAHVDMNSADTYIAIGVEKDKFWAGYNQEVAPKASRQQRMNP